MKEEQQNDVLQNLPNNVGSLEVNSNIPSEYVSERQTENNNNKTRFTKVNDDFLLTQIGIDQNTNLNNSQNENANDNALEEAINKDKTNSNQNLNKNSNNNNQNSALLNVNKQTYNIKIIVLGDIAVGKTSIIKRYITNTFTEQHKTTISTEQNKKKINLDGETIVNLNIWDTAGEEQFMSVTKQFYNESHGAMIVYDLTNKDTFLKIKRWIKDLNETAPKDVVIMIVGNKSDLTEKKIELGDELVQYKKTYLYQDVSAKGGSNISLAFENLTEKIIDVLKNKKDVEPRKSVPLRKVSKSKKKKKCNC